MTRAMENLDTTKQSVLDTIAEIQDMKRAAGKNPDMATMDEVMNGVRVEVLESLRSLCREHRLEYRKTVNGIVMFGIKKDSTT